MKQGKAPSAMKTHQVLAALCGGRRLTVALALQSLGVYALSQECGRLRKLGWDIKGRMIKTSKGVHCKEYYL